MVTLHRSRLPRSPPCMQAAPSALQRRAVFRQSSWKHEVCVSMLTRKFELNNSSADTPLMRQTSTQGGRGSTASPPRTRSVEGGYPKSSLRKCDFALSASEARLVLANNFLLDAAKNLPPGRGPVGEEDTGVLLEERGVFSLLSFRTATGDCSLPHWQMLLSALSLEPSDPRRTARGSAAAAKGLLS